MGEFELIRAHFSQLGAARADVVLGVGDDCALLSPPEGELLAVSLDCLNAGVHFPRDTCAYDIGYKALAVNLSDLAAMGATPRWFMLGLSLPQVDSAWLSEFARGLAELAQRHRVALVGGDTTRGPLAISIQIQGSVPSQLALRRSGAQVGDGIWLTGPVGDAGQGLVLALQQAQITAESDYLLTRLNRPTPRVTQGLALRGRASAAIDISDGLLADLGHILAASQVGACVAIEHLPLSTELVAACGLAQARQLALTAGDDYELCFCLAPEHEAWLQQSGLACYKIGQIQADRGLRLQLDGADFVPPSFSGFEHF